MLIFFLVSIIVLLSSLLGVSLYFLLKFSKIIMVFEDDLGATINVLNEVEDVISNVLEMEIFYESPEIKKEVDKMLEQVKICRLSINKIVSRFTARSKQQYYFIEEAEPEMEQYVPRLPGQPQGTPNPLELIQNRGINLDV